MRYTSKPFQENPRNEFGLTWIFLNIQARLSLDFQEILTSFFLQENRLCEVPVNQCIALSGGSTASVTACHGQPTNQWVDKQRVGILAGSGELYGHIREVSLVDYFLEWGVTDQESEKMSPVAFMKCV